MGIRAKMELRPKPYKMRTVQILTEKNRTGTASKMPKTFETGRNTSAIVEHRQYPKSVMVWGGNCASVKTPLVFVEEGVKISQKVYQRDIIEDFELPWHQKHFVNTNWTLQQDSAPIRKSQKTQEWCKVNFPGMISSEE
ncbi:uncharacterized protein TNCV_1403271 [Trichonephila clavipes]|nr:uncharacterized protein TNCV_1403271 [Trichonephila clavipes]